MALRREAASRPCHALLSLSRRLIIAAMRTNQTIASLAKVAYRRRFAVLMAGGSGTRFWPWSRGALPKQLLPLAGERTMLSETAMRVRKLVPAENVIVVTAKHLRRAVAEALPWVPPSGILCEPVGRNTAPCVAWAALEVQQRDRDGVMIVLPADHVVEPLENFIADLHLSLSVADQLRALVTFGIVPSEAATGYGYIRAGAQLASDCGTAGAFRVAAFHEKPSLRRAERFVASGNYYWNSGMFAWRADTILDAIKAQLPELFSALRRMDRQRRRGRIPQAVVDRAYPRLNGISIDHGVMEKAKRVVMLPSNFAWNDIGSWDAVASLWPRDAHGNSSRDPLVVVDASDNVVATHGKPVALLGVEGLAVVDTGDALLVCPRDRAQDVREVVAELKRAGLTKLL